jgi:hypothetical protein
MQGGCATVSRIGEVSEHVLARVVDHNDRAVYGCDLNSRSAKWGA